MGVNVTAKRDQERDNIQMAGADGVVESGDTFVVSSGGVGYLGGGRGLLENIEEEGRG